MEQTGVFLIGMLAGFMVFWLPFIVTQIIDLVRYRSKYKDGVYHVSKESGDK